MTRAIYIQREDGDFDFVAAFNVEQLPGTDGAGPHPCSDWPAEVAKWLEDEGESVLVKDFAAPHLLTDVLEVPGGKYVTDPEDAEDGDRAWRIKLAAQLNELAKGAYEFFPPRLRTELCEALDRIAVFEEIEFVAGAQP